MPTKKNRAATIDNTIAKRFMSSPHDPMLTPITNDKPSEIVNEMKPTERLSFAISSSTLKRGVKNSNNKYAKIRSTKPNKPQPSISSNVECSEME